MSVSAQGRYHGFAIKDLGPVIMESSDPELVAVKPTDNARAVYLRARKPGRAIVRYTFDTYAEGLGRGAVNDGFEVRVVPAR